VPVSDVRRVGAGQRRVLVMLLLAVAVITAAHAAAILAFDGGSPDWRILAVQAATGLLVFAVAVGYLRSVAHERRREVVERMLLDLLATPRNIEDTAAATVEALHASGLAEASVIAIAGEGDTPLRPIVARGYPRGWLKDAAAMPLDTVLAEPTLQHPSTRHPWTEGATAQLGKRPWVAHLPILSGDEPIGVVLVAVRKPRVLRDPEVRRLLSQHLSAAFDHAALYEAAYARERALEELETRRREFMAAIAHEIRTPLTSVQAFADLLLAGSSEMDETARGLVASLGHGTQRLASLVNDLIDLGRSGDAGYSIRSETIDLGEIVRRAEATLRPALLQRRQTITLDIPERGPGVISDTRVVEQVVMNLISNANRYSPTGGAIRVTAMQLDHSVARLEVSDDGPGIAEDERDRIFEPYYRVRSGPAVPGSGLGLAVTRRLLEETGGRVWVEASPAGGARFCVEMRAAGF
jgi:signal transduction histidine kinase